MVLNRGDSPISVAVEFSPEDVRDVRLAGTITLTKSTLTLFKHAYRDDVEPTFVGTCALPLVRFQSAKRAITLMRGSSYLFDNAALALDLTGERALRKAKQLSNPATWGSVTVFFKHSADCDEITQALLLRHAEELLTDVSISSPGSHRASTTRRRRGSAESSPRRHERHSPSTTGSRSRHLTATAVDDDDVTTRSYRTESARSSRHIARDRSTTRRVPSSRAVRRGIDDATPSNLDDASSIATSRDRAPSSRRRAASSHHEPSPSVVRRQLQPERAGTAPRGGAAMIVSAPPPEAPSSRVSSAHSRRSARDGSRSGRGRDIDSPSTRPRRTRSGHSSTRRQLDTVCSGREDAYTQPVTDVTPRSTLSCKPAKSELEYLVRSVQKLMHHRIHFAQYLHKEMVHQAYLAEEYKLKAALRAGRPPSARRHGAASATISPRRSGGATAAEESARLKEIESRLRDVELLHREAEHERDAAARLRREYEWRQDDMYNRPHLHGASAGSQDPSEVMASVSTAHQMPSVTPVSPRVGSHQVVLHPGAGDANGQLAAQPYGYAGLSPQHAMLPVPYGGHTGNDADLAVAIVDRYVFGEAWARLHPRYELDLRFNAQADLCLALKLPRRLVTITNLVVDQPGLRITAEVHHALDVLPREVLDRRVANNPFRFLQRFYDMRDLLDPHGGDRINGAAPLRQIGARSSPRSRRASRPSSRGAAARRSNANWRQPRRLISDDDDEGYSEFDGDSEDEEDVRNRRALLRRRTEDRVRDHQRRLAKQRRRMKAEVERQLQGYAAQLDEREQIARDRLMLDEATQRQALKRDAHRLGHASLVSSLTSLEDSEAIARATVEVGAARQLQVLMDAHRRQLALLDTMDAERDRRRAILLREAVERADLNDVMNPGATHARGSQVLELERAHRAKLVATEAKARASKLASMKAFLMDAAQEALAGLQADEGAARAELQADVMAAWVDLLLQRDALLGARSRGRARESRAASSPLELRRALRQLGDEEGAERKRIAAEETRRRILYGMEDTVLREEIVRDEVENAELNARGAIVDAMVQQNRDLLARRINDRDQLAGLVSEEHFYRQTIVADEQDAFEVIAELFAEALKELLARRQSPAPVDDDVPRRRRLSSMPRVAKPFHYMTFSPEDMDYMPSAELAIEGILGCAINKNLEVVSISRPLPKAAEEELQFQAGDMILDMAGHSLHSLSHLREVLSARAMQIQAEALEEFPGVPEAMRTKNPALQKYIEVLCEHHNFLVQVLRGCDIYHIIVKS